MPESKKMPEAKICLKEKEKPDQKKNFIDQAGARSQDLLGTSVNDVNEM